MSANDASLCVLSGAVSRLASSSPFFVSSATPAAFWPRNDGQFVSGAAFGPAAHEARPMDDKRTKRRQERGMGFTAPF